MLNFRLIIGTVEAMINTKSILDRYNIKVYDLREVDINDKNSGEKMQKAYIMCCQSTRRIYRRFKKDQDLKEIICEGYKTLF